MRYRSGLTLLEVVVVLLILAALAALLVPLFAGTTEEARRQATNASLKELQTAIMNRYVVDMAGVIPVLTSSPTAAETAIHNGLPGPRPDTTARTVHPQVQFLFVNPQDNSTTSTFDSVSGRGWRGPYLLSGRGIYPGNDLNQDAASRGFTSDYGVARSSPTALDGDSVVLDGWGNPIVIAVNPSSGLWGLVSAGPNEILEIAAATSDDLWIILQ